ncbi:hypothetical protein K8Z61_11365 [Nocardioides sp. TRM66260-LWL]|uniref:hypothetical protein n=1 Tax=Nocardioides sp. TRM66260-LWL TaxID=2874478 RepID=UPI001CC44FBB|nr:hypothetical protein [Nocardioides sp. TRM66260-LWL]MBZ5735098.1 hypothetical protein [Nocardioides sp. TRM66260-LWL]
MADDGRADAPRRRGRPQRLPFDPTPFDAAELDPWPRVAWLLATTRLLGERRDDVAAPATRSAFVASLRERGIPADLTRMSRWESGQHPVPARVVLAYEAVLGLPSAGLLALVREVHRTSGRPGPPAVMVAPEEPDADGPDVETLLESALTAAEPVTGGDWLRLGLGLTRFTSVFLPRAVWSVLCARLLGEIARTSGLDQLRRYEAAVLLIQHPHGQAPMVRALGEWLMRNDVQVVTPMLALLQEIDVDAANGLMLRLLDADVAAIRDHTLGVAAVKLARGHVDAATVASLERHGVRHIGDAHHPLRVQHGLDVAAHLPSDAFESVVQAVPDRLVRSRAELAREHGELLPAKLGRALARAVSLRAQRPFLSAGGESDRMLTHLVHELLCHVHEPRRTTAGHLLAASPYRRALETALLSIADDDRDLVAQRAWDALRTLGHTAHPAVVADRAAAERRPRVAVAALAALRCSPRPLGTVQANALVRVVREHAEPASETVAHAVTALALRAPETLPRLLDHGSGPAHLGLTRAVRWWREVGSMLVDDDAER